MSEKWKEIDGYEGLYDVSDCGQIRSWRKSGRYGGRLGIPKILKPGKDKDGYLHVVLYDHNKKMKSFQVARLVSKMFIPNQDNKPQVNHIDEDKSNNYISNLNWMTNKENINHGTGITRKTGKLTNGKLSKPVLQLNTQGQIIRLWVSAKEASRNGFNQRNISSVCRHVYGRNTHYGFKWEFAKYDLKKEVA